MSVELDHSIENEQFNQLESWIEQLEERLSALRGYL
jgi:hypothetical protein